MIESLRSIGMLSTVLSEGSFQGAADRLNVSATVISQNIKALEERLGCRLLDRSSRILKPTEQGKKLIAPAQAMMDAAQSGLDVLNAEVKDVAGKIIVSVPTMLSGGVLASISEDFLLANPRVQMDLRFENVQRHPIHDDVDLAVGMDQISHKNLEHRTLIGGGGGFYAAPDLADRIERSDPRSVLTKFPLLMCYGFGSTEWTQASEIKENLTLEDVPFRMKCDDVSIIYRLCLSGAGLTNLPHSLVSDDVKRGRLVQVLKSISMQQTHFFAMWNRRSKTAHIVDSFVKHIEDSLVRIRRDTAQ
jgi:DNA-binding transcriptional LysR family regulator